MAVGGSNLMNLRDKNKLKRLEGKLDRAQSRLDKVKGGGDSNKKKMFTKQVKDFKNDINAFKKSFGMSTNTGPLKIDMKGMTPARQLSKDELAGRTARSRMMGGKDGPKGPLGGAISKTPYKPKRKTPKPASGKFGQRKAGGKIEKMYGGGMTKKKMMGGGMTVR